MSDSWLHIISTSPDFVPSSDGSVRRALDLMRVAIPKSEEFDTAIHERPEFFDPGSNWSGVRCPRCHDDLADAWSDQMSDAHDTGNLIFLAPCCGSQLSLNDLDYGWPCGFARFALSARNPNASAFPHETLQELGRMLGTNLRVIWQHL